MINHDPKFEELYAQYTLTPVEDVVKARLEGGSYSLPKISSAWFWYKVGSSDKELSSVEIINSCVCFVGE